MLSAPGSYQGEGVLAQALALGTRGHCWGGLCPPVPPTTAPAPIPMSGSGVDPVENPLGEAAELRAGGSGGTGDPTVHKQSWNSLGGTVRGGWGRVTAPGT